MPSFDYYPKPLELPQRHEVLMRHSQTNEVIGIGSGGDDTAALKNLLESLVLNGASKTDIRSAANQYALVHRSQRGTEAALEVFVRRCSVCGVNNDVHVVGDCLNRWVHLEFLEKPLSDDQPVRLYSNPSEADVNAIDRVTDYRRWPRNVFVGRQGDQWTLVERVSGDPETRRVVLTAEDFSTLVCRAAVSLPPWGDNPLEVRVPFPPRP